MVALTALIPVKEVDAGCAGDCMTCHQNLANSKEHQALKTCIQCHEPSEKKTFLPVASADGCGTRCFDCHNQWPANGWHAPLDKCSECHKVSANILNR
ncbi:MAG: hypothetical protein LRY51_06675 [Geovibrio sp.]|nr:hypothetical protein [Geovibrio sp.]